MDQVFLIKVRLLHSPRSKQVKRAESKWGKSKYNGVSLDLFHTFRAVIRAVIGLICVMFLLQITLSFKAYCCVCCCCYRSLWASRLTVVCAAVVTDLIELTVVFDVLVVYRSISASDSSLLFVVCDAVVTEISELQRLLLCVMLLLQNPQSLRLECIVMCEAIVTDPSELEGLLLCVMLLLQISLSFRPECIVVCEAIATDPSELQRLL